MRQWNDSETIRRNLHSRVLISTKNAVDRAEVVIRLYADTKEFLAGGGTIEYLPSCQCRINAGTNRPFKWGAYGKGGKK